MGRGEGGVVSSCDGNAVSDIIHPAAVAAVGLNRLQCCFGSLQQCHIQNCAALGITDCSYGVYFRLERNR